MSFLRHLPPTCVIGVSYSRCFFPSLKAICDMFVLCVSELCCSVRAHAHLFICIDRWPALPTVVPSLPYRHNMITDTEVNKNQVETVIWEEIRWY